MSWKTRADRDRDAQEHLVALGARYYRLSPLQRLPNEGQRTACGNVIKPKNHFKHPLILSPEGITTRLTDLRRRNAGRADIIIAIHDDPPCVILVDDITAASLPELRRIAVPRATVRTSDGSYQCWMAVPNGIDALQFSRGIARIVGADPGGVGAHQGGKLAGFTNRKPIRALPSGDGPWIELLDCSPEAPPPPYEVVQRILLAGRAVCAEKPSRATTTNRAIHTNDQSASPGTDRSQSGRDFSMACRIIEQGGSIEDVVAALEASSLQRGKWSGYARQTALAAMGRVSSRRKSPSGR